MYFEISFSDTCMIICKNNLNFDGFFNEKLKKNILHYILINAQEVTA